MSLLLLLRPRGTVTPQPPSITSFAPPSGPIGQVVVITGSSFTGATDVSFNGVPALTFQVDADSQITATVPIGASSGPISVTTVIGTGFSATPFTVTVPAAVTPPLPSTLGGIGIWTIEIPRPPQKRKPVFSENMENQDRADLDDIMRMLDS